MKNKAIMKNLKIKKKTLSKNDALKKIFTLQKNFGKKFCNFDNLSFEEKVKWTKEFIICCLNELNEILDWIPWKHWKKKYKKPDEIEIKFEIIDLLHFVVSLALVWNMNAEEFYSLYITKMEENINRQKRGY